MGSPRHNQLPERRSVWALILQYNGTRYAGFQFQKSGTSVQELIERALAICLRENVRVRCACRTDSGVHATGMVAAFKTTKTIRDVRKFTFALNSLTPDDIGIVRVVRVESDFEPRFACIAREYEYLYWIGEKSPFWRGHSWMRKFPFDIAQINEELQDLVGELDFVSFTRKEHAEKKTIRMIDQADFTVRTDPYTGQPWIVALRVRGNAFLHNMLRILAGSIAERSLGKRPSLGEILRAKDRFAAGQTAPAEGLYFRHAFYLPGTGPGLAILDLPDAHPLRTIHARRMELMRELGQGIVHEPNDDEE